MTDVLDVLVLNRQIHGMAPTDYRDAIRERLPDADVRLAATPDERSRLVERARVVTGKDLTRDELDRAAELELFACTFAGTDHLPLDAFAAHDVAVTNASGVHGPGAAEQVLGYILSFARRLGQGWHNSERGVWQHYQADELQDSTVTVVGMGAIGTAILDRLAPFGVDTVGVRHSPEKGGPADEVVGYDEVDAVLPRSDYIVLACPLTETTRGLLDDDTFDHLRPNAFLVNIARGPVVETDALLRALRKERIAGAALDVTDPEPLPHDHELWDFENCLITPHNAGHTPRYWDRLAKIIATNVPRLGSETALENRVQ
ncbi:D-2-hydroxyacid dehydrogenase [Haloarculaceae archaeon H-GB2-1]|nr:D-2-hydroxyacid dehydrogenase [Haloarculaceae archaeon H-GB1-1]MEA5406616.1 D-2-hydroxyacid dehydrogenase [Haloarculaceae archaeon H-GB2-1]